MKKFDGLWRSSEDNTLRRLLSREVPQPEELVLTEEELSLVLSGRQVCHLDLVKKDQRLLTYKKAVDVLSDLATESL